MPSQLLLIRGAKQLLTLRGPSGLRRGAALRELAIIEDGSILIRDGLIVQVGSTRRIENLKEVRAAAEIEVAGAIILPGFVDPGIQLRSLSAAALHKRRKVADSHEESLALLRSCLQHGTLNAQLKAASQALHVDADFTLLRQLNHIGNSPIGTLRTWRIETNLSFDPAATADFATAAHLLSKRKLASRLEIGGRLDFRTCQRIWEAACENHLKMNLAWPNDCASLLPDLLDHLECHFLNSLDLAEPDCDLLCDSQVPVIFSPTGSLLEDQPSDRLRRLADGGAPLALSSGYDAEEMPVFNMQLAIALAVLRLKLTAEEAIVAATVNAAHALGLGHSIGTLEIGKRADLIVMSLPDYREIPRRFGTNHVGMVVREGRIVFNRTGWKVSAA
ncbi:MAG TPA: amidohydrolase family protein [Bryobacteraceae bacterium]|nr:amidohydrolase family protein [Bryobacteraceae bacterium]